MSGMNMSSTGAAAVPEVDGQKPVATQVLATADWQGVEIQAQARTPVRFVVFDGAKEQMVNPSKDASFHLMIMLADERTGEPIAYSSSVWATITNSKGKVVFGETQWPMISRYMGPHYGNDVPHLASGRYKLSVLVGPTTFARTAEYKNVWLKPHSVTADFDWNANTATATLIGANKSTSSGPLGSTGGMSGMSGMSIHTNLSVNGVRATPSRLIATADWQGMRIQTRTAAPTRFYMYDGQGIRSVDPAAGSSFYLMVMLDDKDTSEAITYAPVYATIKSAAGKVVYHGEMEPTTSAFDGPYYGNNVKLPGAGRYTLTLRIDAPHEARHLEYRHVWLHPHTVVERLIWRHVA
jgi:uncharacterized protein involved in high-affinity Fe2+ transport